MSRAVKLLTILGKAVIMGVCFFGNLLGFLLSSALLGLLVAKCIDDKTDD